MSAEIIPFYGLHRDDCAPDSSHTLTIRLDDKTFTRLMAYAGKHMVVLDVGASKALKEFLDPRRR